MPLDCPVCGDAEAEPIAVTEDFAYPVTRESLLALRCTDCGSVYLSPGPAVADRARLFPSPNGERGVPPSAARRLAGWKRGVDAAGVLELGGRGDGPITPRPDRSCELIILNDALEYTPDPIAELASVRTMLRPGGRAIVVLNNLAAPGFRMFGGRHWAGYDFPRQRAVYPIGALRILAARVGLELDSVSSAANAASWLESLRRVLFDWQAPAWLTRRFQRNSLVGLLPFALVEQLFQWRGRGGLLVVSFRRPPENLAAPAPRPGENGSSR
ncbi:MAG: methyltransferase domain-containing protein [Gemmatimonadales bacterium]